jgi:bacteriocin biosynthesis cyclodehydratase domain-containing protein
MPGTNDVRLTPGATLIEDGSDELHIVMANHNVTFVSREVIDVVHKLLDALVDGCNRETAISHAVEHTGVSLELCGYVWSLLDNSGCLSPADTLDAESETWQFWSVQGFDRTQLQAQLLASPVLLAAPDELMEETVAAAELAGLNVRPVGVSRAVPTAAVDDMRSGVCLLGVWGLHYASPQAMLLAKASLEAEVPALFGAASGLIGRIGPCVLPFASACLECTNLRMQAHAGPAEARVVQAMRASYPARISSPPTHPSFRQAALATYMVEASRICMNMPPMTVGGLIECQFGVPGSRRRTLNRVPNCPLCHPAKPKAFGWDAIFRGPVLNEEMQ